MRVANSIQGSSAFAIYAAFFFDPAGRPGPPLRLRRRRPFVGFAASLFCAAFSATAFGGRPGPPGCHLPRRFRRRPLFAFGLVLEMLPNNEWMAEPTSCCTMSRMTVNKLFCLGILPPLAARDTLNRAHQQNSGTVAAKHA